MPKYSGNLINVNGTLFFTAYDSIHGTELWKTDGSTAGTKLVKDINQGSGSSFSQYIRDFVNVNGTLIFVANDGTNGFELWKSDGTAAGTVMVKDIYPGTYVNFWGQTYVASSVPYALTDFNGTLLFTANDGTHGSELWKSDGTAAGTVIVDDINPGHYSSRPEELTNVNGTLFFTANDGTHGTELWKTDGTAAGTVRVSDIYPGIGGSYIKELMNINGTLFFTAEDDTHGFELWKSDGTAAGTSMVGDINPGSGNSYASNLTNVNGTLFFVASPDGKSHDGKMYYLAPQLIPGDFNADGHVDATDLGPAMQALTNPSAFETQYGISATDLQTIGDVNGDGQFNNADLQRLLILLRTGGGSTAQNSITATQTPQTDNSNTVVQSVIISSNPSTSSTSEMATLSAEIIQPAVAQQPPKDALQPTVNVASIPVTENQTPPVNSLPLDDSSFSAPPEADSEAKSSSPTEFQPSEPFDGAAQQSSPEKISPKIANDTATAITQPHHVALAAVDQVLLDHGDDFRRHPLRQPNPQIAADDSFLSELFASWTQA